MTENKRFQYVKNTYKHYIHDTEKDGEWKKGYRGTYGEFDLDKLTIELNKREDRINHLKNENEQLKQTIDDLISEFEGYHKSLEETKDYDKQFEVTSCPYEIRNNKSMDYYWLEHQGNVIGICNVLNEQSEKINELEKENQMIKQDNDLKFWKHQFMQQHNSTQLIMYELSLAIDKGYAVSEDFQKYLEGLKTEFDENIEKVRRLEE